MSRKLSFAMILGASALLWTACDDGEKMCGDGAICLDDAGPPVGEDAGDDVEVDSGTVDPGDCSLVEGRSIGAACILGSTCQGGLECEAAGGIPITPVDRAGDPVVDGSGTPLVVGATLNAGSMCSETCRVDGPNTCGDCAACGNGGLVGRIAFGAGQDSAGNALGLCRQSCTPSDTDRGGCREGYACDPSTNTCVDACTSDDWCKIVDVTVTDDGFIDQWVYDPTFPSSCNATTGRCEFQACLVGAEPEADQLGADGHGAGCEAGQSCIWDGSSGPAADANGICFPGEYNDITESNVGGACDSAADCYSPFGYGACLNEIFNPSLLGDLSGACTIANCGVFDDGMGGAIDGILPGVETNIPVCDSSAGELCVNFAPSGPPQTFCMKSCETASECAPGYACAVLLTDGGRLCWPSCSTDDECNADLGQTCLNEAGAACGEEDSCWCGTETTTPDPDGGMSDDAGTDPDAGTADAGADAGV